MINNAKTKKEIKKSGSRALSKDRPLKVSQLRIVDNTLKSHCCHVENGGHNYQFLRYDNYGWCSKCNSEILV